MDALVYWRASTLRKPVSEGFTSPLPPSPTTTQRHQQREPIADQQVHIRSQSEPPTIAEIRKVEEEDKAEAIGGKVNGTVVLGTGSTGSAKKPTSSSWVQWWSRSRKKDLRDTKAKDTTKNVENINGVLDTVRICFLILIRSFLDADITILRIQIVPVHHCHCHLNPKVF